MRPEPPIAELPSEVTFSLDEAATLLFVADTAVERTPRGSSEHMTARRAQRLITSRLWPDLGELLDDGDQVEGSVGDVTNTETRITVPEAARRLGLPGDEVYRLIFRGVLVGGPEEDGAVYVSIASVEQYLARQPADAKEV